MYYLTISRAAHDPIQIMRAWQLLRKEIGEDRLVDLVQLRLQPVQKLVQTLHQDPLD